MSESENKKKKPKRGERRVYVRANGESSLRVEEWPPHAWAVVDGVPFERTGHACDDDEDGPNAIVYVERPAKLYLARREGVIDTQRRAAEELALMPPLEVRR